MTREHSCARGLGLIVLAAILTATAAVAPGTPWAARSAAGGDFATDDSPWAKVTALIASGLEQKNIPSVSIAVARQGKVIWERSFGWADRENHIQASPSTAYSLASTTKPMVATALMTLARTGKVDLDAPVEGYIGPGLLRVYEGSAGDVTLRRLLHHTSGLPAHFNYFYADEPDRPRPLEETIRRFGIIVRRPGEKFQYANLGYGIIGDVVSRVSGRPLADFLKEDVFRPLAMSNAVFGPDPEHPGLAVEYDGRGGRLPFHWCDTPGAAHAYASVHDLIRFGMFHLRDHLKDQKAILDDASIERMQTEKDGTTHPGREGESYGLGWFLSDQAPGPRAVWHEGGWTGASAMLKIIPSEDIAVAVLINTFNSEFINEVTDEAVRSVIPGYGQAQNQGSAATTPSTPPAFNLPPGLYSGEIRTFERAIPLSLDVNERGEMAAHLGDPSSAARLVRQAPAIVPREPGELIVYFPGPLGDPDPARHPHNVLLDVRWAGDELAGSATAMSLGGLGFKGIEDQRMHFNLAYPVTLRRANSSSTP